MKKIDFKPIVRAAQTAIIKNSPNILLGIGLGGMLGSVALAVKATPKAVEHIHENSKRAHKGNPHAYTKIEAVKSCWKDYIPAAGAFTLSAACILGANYITTKRTAALTAAYKLTETAYKEYREATLETVGEKKEREITDNISKKVIADNPLGENEVVITNYGVHLCLDPLSGRYFRSNRENIQRAVNEFNARLILDNSLTLNDFYDKLGLDDTVLGDELGWYYYGDGEKDLVNVYLSTQLAKNGEPCIVLNYDVPPRYFSDCTWFG